MILVTGATGLNGKALVRQLSAKGVLLRALVRNVGKAAELAALPNVEIVVADMAKPETLPAALRGVERAMLNSSADPAMLEVQSNFIAAAAKAGVKHVVKLSGIMPELDSPFRFARMHGEIEKRLEAAGMAFTHLRAGEFMPTYFRQVPSIVAKGALFLPMENQRIASIDVGDLAEIAAMILTSPGHEGKIYPLTGPEALTMAEVAEKLSAATGQDDQIHQCSARGCQTGPARRRRTALHRGCAGRTFRRAAQGQGVGGFTRCADFTRTASDELCGVCRAQCGDLSW
jgi:uncharacterized protein YbjT (DUF2867 family)